MVANRHARYGVWRRVHFGGCAGDLGFVVQDAGCRRTCFCGDFLFWGTGWEARGRGGPSRPPKRDGRSRLRCGLGLLHNDGDPTRRLDIRVDELLTALKGSGLTRQDFDAGAGRVLEKAIQFGTPIGAVSTAHLFAAMVGGEDAICASDFALLECLRSVCRRRSRRSFAGRNKKVVAQACAAATWSSRPTLGDPRAGSQSGSERAPI